MLTQEILSGRNKGKENDVVSKVLSRLRDINGFRRDEVTQEEMRRDVAERLFRSGIVFRAFLLHIAKPHIYPIADQHVFRAYALHTKKPPGWKSDNWEAYDGYRAYFSEIADAMGIERSAYNVRHLKEIDSALMVFGKFLKAYVPDSELT